MLRIFSVILALTITIPVLAQDKKREDEVKKQIAAAKDTLKHADIKGEIVELGDFLFVTAAPETRVKAIAAVAQKTYDYTYKFLKFGEDDKHWPGKLTVYFIPDRKEFTSFMRTIEQRKPDARDVLAVRTQGDTPYILIGQISGVKTADADLGNMLGEAIARGMFDHKAIVKPNLGGLPGWLTTGFSKAMFLRADGNAAKLAAHRAKVKTYFTKAKLPTLKASDLWTNPSMKDWDTLSTSLVEFLMANFDHDKFKRFVRALVPSDPNAGPPTVEAILMTVDLTPDTLDMQWKAWVAKQK